MAKKAFKKSGKINKAQAIRDALTAMGVDARNKDVIALLKKKKIAVSPAQVSNIKKDLRGGKRGRPKKGAVSVGGLMAAKRLIAATGSVEKARACLATLVELR